MAINKVEFDGQTLIDLTGDTVTQQDVLNGKSFHTPDGVQRSGTATIPVSDVTVDGTSVVTNSVAEVVTDNLAPTVTEASSRTNLAVGDSLKTIISKIKKFFSDLKTVAFTGAYSDLSGTPTNLNQFTNGPGYITSSGSCAYATSAGSATDSTKVAKAGDTMSGVLSSTYKSASWKNSWTNSAVSLADSEGSFGGWICGPTKNGRIAIQSYQANDDKLYIGYASRGRTTNSNERQVCWNGATGKWECDITGNCDGSAGSVAWGNVSGRPTKVSQFTNDSGYTTASGHNHGLLHNDLTVTLANTTTDSGWSMFNSSYTGFLLKSVRFSGSSPAWGVGNYGAGVCFGGSDTKGVLSVGYGSPNIKIAGGNGTKPVWYVQLTGTNAKSYNLDSMPYAQSAGSATDQTARNTANAALPKAGGDMTGSVNFKSGKGINFYNSANNNFSDISTSSNGTTFLRSSHGWINLCTNNQVQCRNFGDSGWVNIAAANVSSSRRFKENIKDLTEEEAKKLLDVRTVTFDFKETYAPSSDWEHERFNQSGVIAEEVLDIYPTLVRFSNYEEPEKDPIPTFVEYSHFVPYLIKMVQMQQKEIDQLKAEVAELKR